MGYSHPVGSAADNSADRLRNTLSPIEAEALKILLQSGDIRKFAETSGVMPEVLIDGINEKAAEIIGDSLIGFDGETAEIYEDYRGIAERAAETRGG